MKALEIKEKRLSLGLTQKELAKLMGISTQTINGYENGKEIPSTKYQILDTILNKTISNIVNNSSKLLAKNNVGFDGKIGQIEERIKEHQEICNLLFDDNEGINHQKEIIRLLQIQIELIKKAKIDKFNDQES